MRAQLRPHEESICKHCGLRIWRITDSQGTGWLHTDIWPANPCPAKPSTKAAPMTDPAQSEVIALRAQIEEDKIATAEINEIVAKYQADDSALRATVKALREALEAMLDSAHPYPVIHPTMTAAWFKARAAIELTKEK